jgi:hypothetical protein
MIENDAVKQFKNYWDVKQFKNYWEWQHQLLAKYFMENDRTVWTSPDIKKLDPAELKGILAYTNTAQSKSEDSASDETSTQSPATEDTPPAEPPRLIIS